MYRILIYTFTPGLAGEGTIEVPGVFELEDFDSVINVTRNSILYDPKEGPAGASLSISGGNTVLTLEQTTSYCESTDKLQIQVLSNNSAETLPVSVSVTGAVDTLNGLSVPEYDYISLSYAGSNLTQVVYKLGGSGGTTVATLDLTYDGSNNLLTVTKV